MRKKYSHPGWTGEPYKSDFEAKWGTIKLEEMLDCPDMGQVEAVKKAKSLGFTYMILDRPSKWGNRLYKISGRSAQCVERMLTYLERNAERTQKRYADSTKERVYQIVRSAKARANQRGTPFDLDPENILQRVLVGKCEATGIDLNLSKLNSAFAPSLDQINPSGGYTQDNVMLVCNIYNIMKFDFGVDEVEAFIEHIRAGTWMPKRG